MSENIEKIKNIIKTKDKRFWLMVFVVFSTLFVFVIWTMDFKNVFSYKKNKGVNGNFDFVTMKNEVQGDMNKTLDEFSKLIEKKMEENNLNNSVETVDLKKNGRCA